MFTGTAGFFENKKDLFNLILILFGNIVGTSIIALLVNIAMPTLVPIASGILASRMQNTIVTNFNEFQRNKFLGSKTKGVLHTFIGS